MKKLIAMLLALAMCFTLVACGGNTPPANGDENGESGSTPTRLNLATATSGGAFYAAGLACAQVISDKTVHRASATTSSGSVENVSLLADGEANLVVQQSDIFIDAVNGTGKFEGNPHPDMRIVLPILSQQYNIVIRDGSGINSIADFKGKNIVVGEAGSGQAVTMEKVLSSFNITMDDINGSSLGISEGLDAMRNGLADALITPGATPVSSVADALSGNSNCRLYSLTEEEKDTLLTDWGFMTQMDIAADTYPGQTETVTAVGHIGFIACNADLPEDVVYDIVMALYNNQADVLAINPQMNGPCFLNPEESINTMAASGVPLHPGAERAMRELGLIK